MNGVFRDMTEATAAERDEFVKQVTRFDGPSLRQVRLLCNVSLEELADFSKIRRSYLEYIEEENFRLLPAAVYVKGFVAIVATILGLPVERVCTEYMRGYR